jgi:hypothetical protein
MMKTKFLTPERSWVLVFSICLVLLTAIPYLIAASQLGGEFTGSLIGVEDGNSYIAKMLEGAQGDWLFRSPYTTANQSGALIYLPYLLLGKLFGASVQHGTLVLAFHLFRSLAIMALCFAIYDFFSLFLQDEKLRRLGLVLATLGNGFGWFVLFLGFPSLFGTIPLDFYSPEAFGFLAIFSLPHLVLARALLLWGLSGYLKLGSDENPKGSSKKVLPILGIWLAMALSHLITAGLGLLLISAHLIFVTVKESLSKKHLIMDSVRFQAVLLAWIAVLPILTYNAWVYWQDSYLRAWAAQNQILSPNPIHYLIAYALVLPLAYFGVRRLLRTHWYQGSFFLIWLILLPFLLYAPVGLQRRLSEGAWLALLVLALFAFQSTNQRAKKGIPPVRDTRELWLFSLAFPTTLMIFLGSITAAQTVELPLFRPETELRAFEELGAVADRNDVVLASYTTGNALPAWIPVRVIAGHGPESVNLENLLSKIQSVYRGRTSEDSRLEFLQKYGVSYIFYGPNEEVLGSWQPANEPYLELIVILDQYQIYRVSPEALN